LDATGNWSNYKKDDDGDETWDLDQNRTHNAVNEMTAIAGISTHVAHDRAGNMTKTPKPDDWNAHFDLTYDAWNRLVKVEDGEDTVAEYSYDGRNFRIVKKTYTGGELDETRHFYYNHQWQCLEERVDASTKADRQFVWGLRYIDDLCLRDRNADGQPQTGDLGKSASGLEERLYALQDPNWNLVALSDTSGTIQERYTYQAYGKPTVLTGAFASRSSSTYAWQILYAGYRWDPEVAWYHVRHRNLLSHLGRWDRRDPLECEDTGSVYLYVGANPVQDVDPHGQQTGVVEIGVIVLAPTAYELAVAAGAAALGAALLIYKSCSLDIQDHRPHHYWMRFRQLFPPKRQKCYFRHYQARVWCCNKLIYRAQFPYGPCYKYINGIPPVTVDVYPF